MQKRMRSDFSNYENEYILNTEYQVSLVKVLIDNIVNKVSVDNVHNVEHKTIITIFLMLKIKGNVSIKQ